MPSSPTKERLRKIKAVAENRQAGLVLVLEDIHDPHNAAAIIRTCDGLGIQEVYFIFANEQKYNPRRVGKVSSSSANKWLTFHTFTSTTDCFKELKKKGYKIAVTILDKEAKNLKTAKLTDAKLALVVGNEHRGASKEAVALADKKLYLPMAGFVQSFNVSVSAALFLYEIIRQRDKSKKSFKISEREAKKLLADFKKR